MSIDEQYAAVAHRHDDCPICNSPALIQDVVVPRTAYDRLIASIVHFIAYARSLYGKKIEVKEG